MTSGFWIAYAVKLGIAALVLAALYAAGRKLRHASLPMRGRERCVSVVDAAMLSQGCAVYVLRAGTRYFLLGGTNSSISTLAELSEAELPAKR